jgi:hypothetical protein
MVLSKNREPPNTGRYQAEKDVKFPFLTRAGIGHISLPKEEKRNVQDAMKDVMFLSLPQLEWMP